MSSKIIHNLWKWGWPNIFYVKHHQVTYNFKVFEKDNDRLKLEFFTSIQKKMVLLEVWRKLRSWKLIEPFLHFCIVVKYAKLQTGVTFMDWEKNRFHQSSSFFKSFQKMICRLIWGISYEILKQPYPTPNFQKSCIALEFTKKYSFNYSRKKYWFY